MDAELWSQAARATGRAVVAVSAAASVCGQLTCPFICAGSLYLRRDAATPLGSGAIGGNSGGVARASLNPRLIAGIPPGWRVELPLGWRGFRAQ